MFSFYAAVLIDEAESGNTARPARLSTTPSAPQAESNRDKPNISISENKSPAVIKEGSLIVPPKTKTAGTEDHQGNDTQPDRQPPKEDSHKESSFVKNEKPNENTKEPSSDTPKMQSEAMPIPKEGSDNGQRMEKGKVSV